MTRRRELWRRSGGGGETALAAATAVTDCTSLFKVSCEASELGKPYSKGNSSGGGGVVRGRKFQERLQRRRWRWRQRLLQGLHLQQEQQRWQGSTCHHSISCNMSVITYKYIHAVFLNIFLHSIICNMFVNTFKYRVLYFYYYL